MQVYEHHFVVIRFHLKFNLKKVTGGWRSSHIR